MTLTYRLVHEALQLGYLSIETENQLQHLCDIGSGLEDDLDVMLLKQAIGFGHVKRQATQLKQAAKEKTVVSRAA